MQHTTSISNKDVWQNVLVDIELTVSKANFNTWFRGTHITKREEGVVYVGVPSQICKDWLRDKHHKTILEALRNVLPEVRGVEYVIAKESKQESSRAPEAPRPDAGSGALPLHEHYVNRADNLNPRYTFDSFIVGPFNELAHAAAQAVINNLGIIYNPLFIYGATGYGKTHLIQAIGNQVKKHHPNKKVFYVTSEKFSTDLVTGIQNNTIAQIKEKYRQYDVLIMDDVQFLSGREKSQEELFHLFNSLYENNKQIVFSSDQHPYYIPKLEERLQSRFSQGMIVDISKPDHESRVAILRAKSAQHDFYLDDALIDYIAETVEGNIRDIEGVLNRVMCHSQLKGGTLTVEDLKHLIKDAVKPTRTLSHKEVVRIVADFYHTEESAIYEKTRKKEVVKPRQLIMFLMREDFGISYPAIGQKLGGRDHTTVIHSCEKIKKDLEADSALQQELYQIRAMLK
ncbi:chromosomal replication initiator protein DnaA [Patescibacteria group bacterium]|jgi:chromosomal replication initiator protein|nr:chromosomal replication initiator protein DnaA [Patescibacteria group bacterium]